LCEKTKESIRTIAKRTGIPKSSVARHHSTIKSRQQYPESYLWETPEGEKWLRLLVFAVIYEFGIKRGIGSDSLSEFFHSLHLEKRIACSASALRQLEVQMKEQIIAYGVAQSESCKGETPIDICVGTDETFFGLPILVAIELASGFIFTESKCDNRTYATWWEQVSGWFDREHWNCRILVSDGAKALVKLAISGLGCPSVPDLFHLLYGLSKSLGTSLARQRIQLQKQEHILQEQVKVNSSPHITAQIQALQNQLLSLEVDHEDYQQSLHTLSQTIHPFSLKTGESQLGLELPANLQAPLATLTRLSQTYAQTTSQAALTRLQQQIPALKSALHAWWLWVMESLSTQTQDINTQDWVLTCLLPWVYWHQQTEKTRSGKLKQSYQQATLQAHKHFLEDDFTQSLSHIQQQQWIDWALWMCAKFQRTSSAVEGRNGYLSVLNHANRGFTEKTLKVLTIIHNFDLKRNDGTTAAQRLFGKPFPDLFESVVLNMGELPRPRQSQKTPKSKTLTVHSVPS
jgi:hypothetical protein